MGRETVDVSAAGCVQLTPVGEEAEWLATSLYGPRVAPHLENFREMYGVAPQDAEAWTQYRRHGHG